MRYPEYVEINGKKYKINTDFKVALECNKIAEDESITGYERGLALIYKLFGDAGLDDKENYDKLLELGLKYLLCGETKKKSNDKPDMDFEQDYGLIWVSMYSEYHGLDIDKTEIHWWRFIELMEGLSNSEFGNCCALNKVRNLRSYDVSKVKDKKERDRILRAQDAFKLKKYSKKEVSTEQRERANNLLKQLGIERK